MSDNDHGNSEKYFEFCPGTTRLFRKRWGGVLVGKVRNIKRDILEGVLA